MADTDPEDLGIMLADSLDIDALLDETGDTTKAALLPEVQRSFQIQFQENQVHVQHELLDTAFHDMLRSSYTDPGDQTKEGLVEMARDYARDAFHEYANIVLGDVGVDKRVSYSDLPDDTHPMFTFKSAIVDGYWNDTAQTLIEQSETA